MICRHHPTCPGCPLLDQPYPAQLALKKQRLASAFGHFPHLPAAPEVTPARRTLGYRHRLKLPLHITREHAAIGLYHPQSGKVLDTPDCPVLAPQLRAALPNLLVWARGKTDLHSLDLRVSAASGEIAAVFAAAGGDLPGGPRAARVLMERVPGLVSVAVSRADKARRKVMGQAPKVVAGIHAIDESIGETRYRLFPGAFFQVDPDNAEALHTLVRTAVGEARSVLDLYAGVGAYGLMLAKGADRVVLVEEVAEACKAARAMAPANVTVIEGKVEEADLRGRFDCAVLNPARRGADPATLARLSRLCSRLVYVSCGPETLARDLDCLAAHGLRVRGTWALDLFPQTPEVETVVLLEKGPPVSAWNIPGGKARGPWQGEPSGVIGRPERVVALVIGNTRDSGVIHGARYTKIGMVATHSLLRIEPEGPIIPVLAALARTGHPVAGRDPGTARFFAEKAGLVRPFVHIERAGEARAPLHGDLALVLEALGAEPRLMERLGLRPPAAR